MGIAWLRWAAVAAELDDEPARVSMVTARAHNTAAAAGLEVRRLNALALALAREAAEAGGGWWARWW